MKKQVKDHEKDKFKEFLQLNHYLNGSYDKHEDFAQLNDKINEISKGFKAGNANRIFYLALPPTVYTSVTQLIHDHCRMKK